MPRKVTLPGSAEPLRTAPPIERAVLGPDFPVSRSTGRVRHEEKITIYVSRDELVRLEQARLSIRADHGLALDRGRLVREAVAAALDDFDTHGVDAEILRRIVES